MKNFLLVLFAAVMLAMPAVAQVTADDTAAIFSAWGARQAGQTVKFDHGPKGFMRLFCMFWCIPYVEKAPDSLQDWNWGRTLAVTEVPADSPRFPGQPESCKFVGFSRSSVGAGFVVSGRCEDHSVFTPGVPAGKWRAYLATLVPPASAKVVP